MFLTWTSVGRLRTKIYMMWNAWKGSLYHLWKAPRSACTCAQSDQLSIICLWRSPANNIWIRKSYSCGYSLLWPRPLYIPYLLYVFGQTGLSTQCRHRWDAAECGISSGSTLFATHPAIFRQVVNCTCSNFITSMVRSCGDWILRVNTEGYVKI